MRNFVVITRRRRLINTDPQRRCYNGCHAKSELVWTEWEALESCPTVEKAEERIKFWESLNENAVEARGESAKRQFLIEDVNLGRNYRYEHVYCNVQSKRYSNSS